MKIFYLITKSEHGGAQTHVAQLIGYFISQGHDVTVMGGYGGWLQEETEKINGRFLLNPYMSNSLNPIKVLKSFIQIRKALRDYSPDLVHCHSSVAGFLGRMALMGRIPVIFTSHCWCFDEGMPSWKRYILLNLERLAARYSAKIVCVSDFVRNSAVKNRIVSPDKVVTIYNGIEEIDYPSVKKNEKISIVFVGRLAEPKEPLLLLQVYNELPLELKEKSRILIIGDGPQRSQLEGFISEKGLKDVKLTGSLPREEVFRILRECHIFALISKWEGFPYTILEAMRTGLPVIATDVGGINEAIDTGCGVLVKSGDKEGIKNALVRLISSPELSKRMGVNAMEKVRQKFSLKDMYRKTEGIYLECL